MKIQIGGQMLVPWTRWLHLHTSMHGSLLGDNSEQQCGLGTRILRHTDLHLFSAPCHLG